MLYDIVLVSAIHHVLIIISQVNLQNLGSVWEAIYFGGIVQLRINNSESITFPSFLQVRTLLQEESWSRASGPPYLRAPLPGQL